LFCSPLFFSENLNLFLQPYKIKNNLPLKAKNPKLKEPTEKGKTKDFLESLETLNKKRVMKRKYKPKNKTNLNTRKKKSVESSKGTNLKNAKKDKRHVKRHKTLEQLKDRKVDVTINSPKE